MIATVSELGKKSSLVAAILAALPLTSILAMLWLYSDTRDAGAVAELSVGIFWAVLPSFVFFLSFPLLLRAGLRFPLAMAGACALMVAGYAAYAGILRRI